MIAGPPALPAAGGTFVAQWTSTGGRYGTFSAPADMPASPSTKFKLVQGALEKSNVRPIIEMSRMIEVSRAYAMIANLLQSRGDLTKTALQQLSDVPTS